MYAVLHVLKPVLVNIIPPQNILCVRFFFPALPFLFAFLHFLRIIIRNWGTEHRDDLCALFFFLFCFILKINIYFVMPLFHRLRVELQTNDERCGEDHLYRRWKSPLFFLQIIMRHFVIVINCRNGRASGSAISRCPHERNEEMFYLQSLSRSQKIRNIFENASKSYDVWKRWRILFVPTQLNIIIHRYTIH